MLAYCAIGNRDNETWSGLFFCMTYMALFCMFRKEKNKTIRNVGISLSISLFLYASSKLFIEYDIEKYYTFIPFTIIFTGLFCLQNRDK